MSLYVQEFTAPDGSALPKLIFGSDTLPWIFLNGSWHVLSNRAYTTAAPSNNPMAVVNARDARFRFKIGLLSSGGCLYFRVKSNKDWFRVRFYRNQLRVRKSRQVPVYKTQYRWRMQFTETTFCTGRGYSGHGHTLYSSWLDYRTSKPTSDLNHYGYFDCHGAMVYAYRYHHHPYNGSTEETRTVLSHYNTEYYYETEYIYTIYLERSVGGSIGSLAALTGSLSAIEIDHYDTKFDIYINGSSIKNSTLSKTDSTDGSATLIGFGLGRTDYAVYPYIDAVELEIFAIKPDIPTNLSHTSINTVRTPSFSCYVSDPNTTQLIKARFYIYLEDGVTLVGTVDSTYKAGAHTAVAEYNSGLPLGNYVVKARALDDTGKSSVLTSAVDFRITDPVVLPAITLLWDIKPYVLADFSLLWNITENNVADFTLLWRIAQLVVVDRKLLWHQKTAWENQYLPDEDTTWEEVFLRQHAEVGPDFSGLVTEFVEATV